MAWMLEANIWQCWQTALNPFAQFRDAARQIEEEEHVQPNLRKGYFQEKVKGVVK
jgi:hypothetical protein